MACTSPDPACGGTGVVTTCLGCCCRYVRALKPRLVSELLPGSTLNAPYCSLAVPGHRNQGCGGCLAGPGKVCRPGGAPRCVRQVHACTVVEVLQGRLGPLGGLCGVGFSYPCGPVHAVQVSAGTLNSMCACMLVCTSWYALELCSAPQGPGPNKRQALLISSHACTCTCASASTSCAWEALQCATFCNAEHGSCSG